MQPKSQKKVSIIKFNKMSKTLDGNIMIADHEDIYFIVSPEKRKITILSKKDLSDRFFSIQNRFLDFAKEKGLIVLGTESTGYLPGMFEFLYPESEDKNETISVILKQISKFLAKEKEIYDKLHKMENDMEKRLLTPDEDNSTELGEIPHEDKKGGMITNPYMNYINAWFGWYI
jgi:hypothetical protein